MTTTSEPAAPKPELMPPRAEVEADQIFPEGEQDRRDDRADEKGDEADERCRDARLRLTRACEQCLNGLGALFADEAGDLRDDLATGGFLAEYEASNRDHDDQQWREREGRVAGQRRAHPRRVVVAPRLNRLPRQTLILTNCLHANQSCKNGPVSVSAQRRTDWPSMESRETV